MQLCRCRDRIRRVLLLSRRCPLRSQEIGSPGTVHRVRLGARGLMFAIPLAMPCSWLLKGTKPVVADNPLKVHLSMSRPYFSKWWHQAGDGLHWAEKEGCWQGHLEARSPQAQHRGQFVCWETAQQRQIFQTLCPPGVSHAHTCVLTRPHPQRHACVEQMDSMHKHMSEYVCACVHSIHLTYIRQLGHKFDFSLDFEGMYN